MGGSAEGCVAAVLGTQEARSRAEAELAEALRKEGELMAELAAARALAQAASAEAAKAAQRLTEQARTTPSLALPSSLLGCLL